MKPSNSWQGIDLPLFFFLVFLPLQWKGSLAVDLGVFQLGLSQIPAWLLLFLGFYRPASFLRFFRCAPAFNLAFLTYYLFLGLSLLWSRHLDVALVAFRPVIRSAIFYMAVGAYLTTIPAGRLSRTIFLAAPLSIFLFISYAAFTVTHTPREQLANYTTSAEDLLSDPNKILLVMVNYTGDQEGLTTDDEEYQTGTIKNAIAAAFNTLLNAFMVFGLVSRQRALNPLTLLGLALYPLVIFALLSRSNFAALVVGFGLVLLTQLISPRIEGRRKVAAASLAVACLLFAGVAIHLGPVQQLTGQGVNRFEETGGDVRFPHYLIVLRAIAKRPLQGYGVGLKAPDGLAVHNLMLGAWFQFGLLGLGLATGYYMVLLFSMASAVRDNLLARFQPTPTLNPIWIPTLLVVPLIRALIIGNFGQYGPPDVTSIAFFFYAYARVRSESV